jgi:hypothetical protein
MLLAVDDGLFSANYTFADICFLIGVIVFGLSLVVRLMTRPVLIDAALVSAGLTALALGWLVL